MIELFITIGQAASALLLIYGACLVLMPARIPQEEPIVLSPVHNDA
jgi:hypothetical protein